MKQFNVAILGATGAVGREMLKILEEYDFPVKELRPLASARSAGTTVPFKCQEILVQEATEQSFEGMDFVLGAVGGGMAKKFAPHIVKAGAVFKYMPGNELPLLRGHVGGIQTHHILHRNVIIGAQLFQFSLHDTAAVRFQTFAAGNGSNGSTGGQQQDFFLIHGEPSNQIVIMVHCLLYLQQDKIARKIPSEFRQTGKTRWFPTGFWSLS